MRTLRFRGGGLFSVYCPDTLLCAPNTGRFLLPEHLYPCSVIATAFTLATTPTSLKHTVQSLIIESLKEKINVSLSRHHAGAGRYQLGSEHAERTGVGVEIEKRFIFLFQRLDDQALNGMLRTSAWLPAVKAVAITEHG